MSANQNAESQQWANYIDLRNDAKPWLQFPTGSSPQDAQIQLVVDMACQWTQNYLGRPVAPTRFDRRFDGYSGFQGAHILLPYYPVLEVVSVKEWWGGSGPHTLVEQTPDNQVDGFQCDYLRGRLTRAFHGLIPKPWFPGARNIEVVWMAGYNPVPADIKMATLELVAHWWRNTQQASRSQFRPQGEYDAEDTRGYFEGVPHRVTALLSPYCQTGMG